MDLPRTKMSSAASQNCFVLCVVEFGPQLSSDWAFGLSKGKWAWSTNCWAPHVLSDLTRFWLTPLKLNVVGFT